VCSPPPRRRSDDLRIGLDSQCVDAAQIIVGNDRNGSLLDDYNGDGPDMGAYETP
jgi:hypothetical protein